MRTSFNRWSVRDWSQAQFLSDNDMSWPGLTDVVFPFFANKM